MGLRVWVMRRRIALALICILIDHWPFGAADASAGALIGLGISAAMFTGLMVLLPTSRTAVTPLLFGFALAALVNLGMGAASSPEAQGDAALIRMALGFGLLGLTIFGGKWVNRIKMARVVARPARTVVALPREEVWRRIEYRPRADALDDFVERFEEAPGRPDAIRVVYRPVDPRIGNWIDVELRDVEPGRRYSICALPDPKGMSGAMSSAMTIALEDLDGGTRLAAVEVDANIGLMDAINVWLDDILADHLAHWRARLEGGRDWSLKRAMLNQIERKKGAKA